MVTSGTGNQVGTTRNSCMGVWCSLLRAACRNSNAFRIVYARRDANIRALINIVGRAIYNAPR